MYLYLELAKHLFLCAKVPMWPIFFLYTPFLDHRVVKEEAGK